MHKKFKQNIDKYIEFQVTVTGSHFVDTGFVFCMVPCSELGEECRMYRGVLGTFVSETAVMCPVWPLKAARKGATYNIHVILDRPSMVDLNRYGILIINKSVPRNTCLTC